MNAQYMMVMMAFLVVVFIGAVFKARRLRKMIRCRYTSRSKQTYEKFVKSDSQKVVFEGKEFKVMPSCVTHHWFEKGFNQLFPMFMPEISFTHESQLPVDPNTGKPVIVSAEVKNLMRSQENMASYAGSQQQAVSQGRMKSGLLDKWMPLIMIGLVVAIGYLIYTNMQMEANDKVTQQAIIDIYQNFNKYGMPVGK
jgi:hypothetical protein